MMSNPTKTRIAAVLLACSALAGPGWQSALAQPAAPPAPAPPAVTPLAPAEPPSRVGLLSQVAGTVSFHLAGATQWEAATANLPVIPGSAFWTQPGAKATLEVTGTRIALDQSTELDVPQLDDETLGAAVPQGRIYVHIRTLRPGATMTVQTPRGVATFAKPGRYEIVAGDFQTPTLIAVVDGEADLSPTAPGAATVKAGPNQTIAITGDGQATPFTATLGTLQRDPFLTAMLAIEAPVRSQAPAYVHQMSGGTLLEEYGDWSTVPEYGAVWYPPAQTGYVPFRNGHWAYVGPWGWTWVDEAPWGFAPSHYGRWGQFGGRWGWLPGAQVENRYPVYAPALVAFLGGVAFRSAIGWVPLGPREPYYPPYRVPPTYVGRVNAGQVPNVTIVQTTYINAFNNRTVLQRPAFINRGAATIVPIAAMRGSRNLEGVARPAPLQGFTPIGLRAPLAPAQVTMGMTPVVARQFNLPPAIQQRPAAPGPVFRAAAPPGARPGPAPTQAPPGVEEPGRFNRGERTPPQGPQPTQPEARPEARPVPASPLPGQPPLPRPEPPAPQIQRPTQPGPAVPGSRPAATPPETPRPEAPRPVAPRPEVARPEPPRPLPPSPPPPRLPPPRPEARPVAPPPMPQVVRPPPRPEPMRAQPPPPRPAPPPPTPAPASPGRTTPPAAPTSSAARPTPATPGSAPGRPTRRTRGTTLAQTQTAATGTTKAPVAADSNHEV